MILYIENPKDSTKNIRIYKFSKVAGYKINIQKSTVFLYTNYQKDKLRKKITFTIASKKIKYLGINLTKVKHLYTENYNSDERNGRRYREMERYSMFMD